MYNFVKLRVSKDSYSGVEMQHALHAESYQINNFNTQKITDGTTQNLLFSNHSQKSRGDVEYYINKQAKQIFLSVFSVDHTVMPVVLTNLGRKFLKPQFLVFSEYGFPGRRHRPRVNARTGDVPNVAR